MALSTQELQLFLPGLTQTQAEAWTGALNAACPRFAIGTPDRLCAFMAQCAHESGGFKRLAENLNYSAVGLTKTWPKRFPSLDFAAGYERQPEKIANYVYASRLGNGDTASGDGWRYKGRGLIQLTGRGNYQSAGAAIGLDLLDQPELLEQPEAAALSAAWFWQSRGLNELADDKTGDDDQEDFIRITQLINGGTVGLADRQALWAKARQIFA
ncbi:MAG: glycoside hydrolase family 19 protein [Gammaproteobacteria bacterium]|nr:glycoside hydrolase family 19 protein [Gammaproteobacteria bacterium]